MAGETGIAKQGSCQQCIWWEVPESWDISGFGSCRKAYREYGRYRDDTLAYAQDCCSYEAKLRCQANFGCVQWEAENNDEQP